jgi:hypothetical protein
MWSSRCSLPVSTDARSIVAATDEPSGSSLVTIVTSELVNRPRTLLIMRWRTEKAISECAGSAFQVPPR